MPILEALESRLSPATVFSIANSSVVEPAPGGTVNLNFTVTRSGDLTSQVTVGYTTISGTAQPGTDFTPETGTTTFASGSATAIIPIPVFGNGVYNNPDLTFSVQLTGIVNVVGPPVTFASTLDAAATGKASYSVKAADINGDGKPDLVVANYGDGNLSVLLNKTAPGAATASFLNAVNVYTGPGLASLAIADVNGDGKPDVIAAEYVNGDFGGYVAVLLNKTATGSTTPQFAAPYAIVPFGGKPRSVAVGDFNGDGKPDIVAANRNTGAVSVLINSTPTARGHAFLFPERGDHHGQRP